MTRWRACAGAVLTWAALAISGLAQAPDAGEPQPGSSLQDSAQGPDGGGRRRLPEWLKLGVELRGRIESEAELGGDPAEHLYLNRLNLSAAVQPAPWLRFYFQGQDARALSLDPGRTYTDLQDTFDVHLAYVDFGRPEQGWLLRAGRQEISVGDERLVGADGYWDCFGQAFDALRVAYAGAGVQAAAFTGFRIQPARRRLDPFDTASRISGLTVRFTTRGDSVVEPYVLWKRGGDTVGLQGEPGHRDVVTPGVRAQGPLPRRLEYNVEMALQRGHVVGDAIDAWAGHWELGWKPLGREFGLRVGLEYNFATGDRSPRDGRYTTFDDLYPAGFNKYGMEDLIAWRNIRYPALGVEVPLSKRWTIYAGCRRYWLASVRDGLYPGGDEFLVRNPAATSADVGSQALVSASYAWLDRWRLYAGYGVLFPGDFLRQSGYRAAVKSAYLLSSFSF